LGLCSKFAATLPRDLCNIPLEMMALDADIIAIRRISRRQFFGGFNG
jgi:hypothetical protein